MLEDYLQELQKITLLQPEEEAALWQAYKEGGDGRGPQPSYRTVPATGI